MSIVRLGCVLASTLTLCALVACSSDDTGTTSSSSGGSSGSSGSTSSSSSSSSGNPANDKCAVPPGSYTATYTTKPGGTGPAGTACQDIPTQEFEIKPRSDDAGAGADAGTAEPQPGCTVDVDEANCKFTSKCVTKANGNTTTTESVMSTKDGKVTGSNSTKMVKDDDSSVIMDCAYDYEWTKK